MAPEKTQQLVAAISKSMSVPSGSQFARSINTYVGFAATNKPWALFSQHWPQLLYSDLTQSCYHTLSVSTLYMFPISSFPSIHF